MSKFRLSLDDIATLESGATPSSIFPNLSSSRHGVSLPVAEVVENRRNAEEMPKSVLSPPPRVSSTSSLLSPIVSNPALHMKARGDDPSESANSDSSTGHTVSVDPSRIPAPGACGHQWTSHGLLTFTCKGLAKATLWHARNRRSPRASSERLQPKFPRTVEDWHLVVNSVVDARTAVDDDDAEAVAHVDISSADNEDESSDEDNEDIYDKYFSPHVNGKELDPLDSVSASSPANDDADVEWFRYPLSPGSVPAPEPLPELGSVVSHDTSYAKIAYSTMSPDLADELQLEQSLSAFAGNARAYRLRRLEGKAAVWDLLQALLFPPPETSSELSIAKSIVSAILTENSADHQFCATVAAVLPWSVEQGGVYADMLYRWGFLSKRAELLKLTSKPQTSQTLNLATYCPQCSSECPTPVCKTCNSNAFNCIICNLPVKSLSTYCVTCSHGGHHECIRQWFAENNKCPTGCGCKCLEGSWEVGEGDVVVGRVERRTEVGGRAVSLLRA